MNSAPHRLPMPGRLLMIGFGCIGQAVLPMLLRHLAWSADQITVVSASETHLPLARQLGATGLAHRLSPENYQATLSPHLKTGDFLLNLSVDVSSLALIALCQQHGALYLDASIEPWAGGYTDPGQTVSQRSNYALREAALSFGRQHPKGPTALVTQGANPGLVSCFVKQALLNLATESHRGLPPPRNRAEWAALAQSQGLKVIQIAERDTQTTLRRKRRGEFVNTWSVAGFLGEGTQPAELGWGTHERHWPPDGARHGFGCDAAIYLKQPGLATRVRSWTPLEGPYQGFLVTHGEAISLADYLTLQMQGRVVYRPTVHYAYHPCDDTVLSIHELAGKDWHAQAKQRLLRDDILGGVDELGVLLLGPAQGAYWYGSRLSIDAARQLMPFNNATSLQVAAGILAGMVWVVRHPQVGVVEPDDLELTEIMTIATPYLGTMVGVHSDWTPLQGRTRLFPQDVDATDPWQFKNIRVS